jgi:hypothetical protein
VLVIGPGVYECDSAALSAGFRSWDSYDYYLLYIRWTNLPVVVRPLVSDRSYLWSR